MGSERVLITGGAGFIGSRLMRLLGQQHEMLSFDVLHPQVHGDAPKPFDFENVQADIADADAVERTIRDFKPTVIYHLAAETGTGQSHDEPRRYCDVNIMGTTNLVEAARRNAPGLHRVIVAGSRAVYGEGAYLDNDLIVPGCPRESTAMAHGDFEVRSASGEALSPVPTPETLPVMPASVYASTKLMQEYILRQCFAGTHVAVRCLRFQNVYGAGQSLKNPYTGVISIMSQQALSGKKLFVYEDGQIVRDFVHVSDVVEALAMALSGGDAVGSAPINIGTGVPATIEVMASKLLGYLGKDPENYEVNGQFRPGDIRYAVADVGTAEAALGWKAKVSFDEGLKEIAEWAIDELK
jgi:dTDP-L-rhamnose 4-epimerase